MTIDEPGAGELTEAAVSRIQAVHDAERLRYEEVVAPRPVGEGRDGGPLPR
ncbi:hypothetical protein [Microbacterium sp. HSID17254]|uniref:hypothetical protein n=1 Tax=Microbacterium sp. HSID17254 TaxID=2419509 RepID=UPI001386CEFF|nr:hypothetical protein [Microbacterium sp. HSID17254]